MKKYYFLIIVALILGLVLTGCSLLSNISQVPATNQSGITNLTKNGLFFDIVGLWHLDEGSGITAYDSSGYGNDGTITGATYTGSASAMFGDALSFDGDGDYVQLPASNNILNTNTFTIEAWFKTSVNHPTYGTGDMEGRLVNLHWKDTASTAVSLYVEQDKIGLLYHEGSMNHAFVKHKVNYFDNTWHHIAVTYDASIYRLYYDGAEVASEAGAFGGFGTYPAYLGTYNGSQRFFNGDIDEVRIWNFALSQNQLGKVYNFEGFLRPVDNLPMVNEVKAGRAIPVKFKLDGYQGLEDIIFVPGYPKSIPILCPGENEPVGIMEFAETAGASSLSYDATGGQYTYVWKTEKIWASSCRQLVVKLIDGTSHIANFTFK